MSPQGDQVVRGNLNCYFPSSDLELLQIRWSAILSYVRGHGKVRTFGHEKSALVASGRPQFWPREVRTPR